MEFSRRDQLIIDTFPMKEKTALQYLKDHNVKMEKSQWYANKKRLRELSREIIYKDAKEFEAKHLDRIKTLRYLQELSFANLENEPDPSKKQRIIDSIKELQYDIATFDEATRDLIEKGETSIPVPEEEKPEQESG